MPSPPAPRRLVHVAAVFAAGIVTATPTPAPACGACYCYDQPVGLTPSVSRDLPLNPRFFATLPDGDTSKLSVTRTSDGQVVPIDVAPAGDAAMRAFWFWPKQPLAPATDYTVQNAVMTTGTAVDTTPPEALDVAIENPTESGACSTLRGASLRVDKLNVGEGPIGSPWLLQIDVTGPNGTERLFWSTPAPMGSVPLGATVSSACRGGLPLADARLGVSYSAVVTLYDAAGNSVQRALPPFQLTDIVPGGCPVPATPAAGGDGTAAPTADGDGGCSTGPSRAGTFAVAAPFALMALAWRRRRRAHVPAVPP